jgi:hypothetical protein
MKGGTLVEHHFPVKLYQGHHKVGFWILERGGINVELSGSKILEISE